MASLVKRMMIYLGVAPDDEYDLDDYDAPAQHPQAVPQQHQPVAQPVAQHHPQAAAYQPPVAEPETAAVRTLPTVSQPGSEMRVKQPTVRPIASARVETVAPTSFNDAQEVADKFKSSQPVIVNLQGAPKELSRRLIDFTSGLCYGLGGQMERVADNVYLLTPTNVEVSAEEKRRLQERGLIDD